MKSHRPIFLDLTAIQFPITAIVSICHRISGVIIFLAIPFLLWLLQLSLIAPETFYDLKYSLPHSSLRWLLWVVMAAVIFHICAGIRHLVMDMGYAESLKAGRQTSMVVFIVAILLTVIAGIYLW